MAGPIRISILADDRASRAFASVSANANGMGVRMGKAGKALGLAMVAGTAIAGAAALKFGAASVKAASDAQQSLGATETVFGRYAKSVVKRSNEAATAVGISANEYRELSNVVGASLTGAGISIQRASVLTGDLNRRAADMAATFGGTTREAVEAVSSALRGETDPIERYGVSIKATDVNARLAAQGQDKLTGAALKSAEMQARLDLIFAKTATSQGAFARESNTLAHQQQVLGAQWENLKAKVGTALLPVLTKLLTVLNSNLMPAFAAISAAVAPVVAWFKALFDGAGEGQGKLSALSAFMQGQVVPAVQAVISAYQGLVAVLLPIIAQVAGAVINGWSQIQPQVASIWGSVKSIVVDALSILTSVVKGATAVISAVWKKFGGTILSYITATMRNVATVLKGAFQIVQGIFKTVSALLRGDWKGAWDGIKTILKGALNVIKGAISQAWAMIRAATSAAWTAIKVLIKAAWDAVIAVIRTQIGVAVALMKGIKDKITGAMSGAKTWLKQIGVNIVTGLVNGIDSVIGWVRDKIEQLADMIPGWVAKKLGIESPSKVMRKIARWIPAGLAKGIDDGTLDVEKAIAKITDLIKKRVDLKDAAKEQAREQRLISILRERYHQLVKTRKAQQRLNEAIRQGDKARRATSRAARGFDLTGDMTKRDIRGAFKELARQVKAAGSDLPKGFGKLRTNAIETAKSLAMHSKKLDKASKRLEELQASAADLKTAVAGIFDNNPFAQGGLASAMLQLQADTNDTKERDALLRAIGNSGWIDTASAAFKALATQADMQTLRDLDTPAEIKAFEAWYADRAAAQQEAGAWAAQAAFGAAIDKQESIIDKQAETFDRLAQRMEAIEDRAQARVEREAQLIGIRVESGAYSGVVKGFAGQTKKSNSKMRSR